MKCGTSKRWKNDWNEYNNESNNSKKLSNKKSNKEKKLTTVRIGRPDGTKGNMLILPCQKTEGNIFITTQPYMSLTINQATEVINALADMIEEMEKQ